MQPSGSKPLLITSAKDVAGPNCSPSASSFQVSENVFKLMELVKKTLDEACSEDTTAFYSGKLLVTARNLVRLVACKYRAIFKSLVAAITVKFNMLLLVFTF